jgi:hypothetical protein
VTRFEPRTPHQPEKLKKLSKNEYVFTPSIFFVNENYAFVTTSVFNRVHAVHRAMTGNGAVSMSGSAESRTGRGLSAQFVIVGRTICRILMCSIPVKNQAVFASGTEFGAFES